MKERVCVRERVTLTQALTLGRAHARQLGNRVAGHDEMAREREIVCVYVCV